MEDHTRELIKHVLKLAASASLFLVQLLGAMFIVAGLVTVWLPIPTGILFFAIGIVILIYSSERFIEFVRGTRKKYPKFDSFMNRMERSVPEPLKEVLGRTNIVVKEKVQEIIQKHRERSHPENKGLPIIEGEFEELANDDKDCPKAEHSTQPAGEERR